MRDPLKRPRPLYASCDHGLEPVLAEELTALGVADARPGHRGVAFSGDWDTLWGANLWCRTANRVLLPVAEMVVRDRTSLYEGVKRVDWPAWFELRRTIAFEATGSAPGLEHAGFVAQVAKDAVCDRFREACGRRPSVERRGADVPLYVHLDGERAVVGLDASGARLHRRGYRTEAGEAPLKETLAAGALALLGWEGASPLLDPMCGAGTFPIEAALVAGRRAPGLLRLGQAGFAFQRWRIHDRGRFARVVAAARAQAVEVTVPICGSDLDPDAVEAARHNASRAGVEVALEARPLEEVTPGEAPGLVLTNPPYGKRLAVDAELYSALGRVLKQRFAGWRAGVLAPDAPDDGPRPSVGLKPTRRVRLRNGPIPCQLSVYELYEGSRR